MLCFRTQRTVVLFIILIIGLLVPSLAVQAQSTRIPDYISRERLYRQIPLKKGYKFEYRHQVKWIDSRQDQPILLKSWNSKHRVAKSLWTGDSWLFFVEVEVRNHSLNIKSGAENRFDTAQTVFQPARDHWLAYRLDNRFLYRNRVMGDSLPQDKQRLLDKFEETGRDSVPWFVLPPYPKNCSPRAAPTNEKCLLQSGKHKGDTSPWKVWYLGERKSSKSSNRIHSFGIRQGHRQTLREFSEGRGLVVEREQGPWQRSIRLINVEQAESGREGDTPANQSLPPNSPSTPPEPSALNQPNSPFSSPETNQPNRPNSPNHPDP